MAGGLAGPPGDSESLRIPPKLRSETQEEETGLHLPHTVKHPANSCCQQPRESFSFQKEGFSLHRFSCCPFISSGQIEESSKKLYLP